MQSAHTACILLTLSTPDYKFTQYSPYISVLSCSAGSEYVNPNLIFSEKLFWLGSMRDVKSVFGKVVF